MELDVKCQPAAETWDGDFKVETGGFELGPIKPWIDVSDFDRIGLTRFFMVIVQSQIQQQGGAWHRVLPEQRNG